jgi:hypothetical protein
VRSDGILPGPCCRSASAWCRRGERYPMRRTRAKVHLEGGPCASPENSRSMRASTSPRASPRSRVPTTRPSSAPPAPARRR